MELAADLLLMEWVMEEAEVLEGALELELELAVRL